MRKHQVIAEVLNVSKPVLLDNTTMQNQDKHSKRKSKEFLNVLKSCAKEWCENTTSHGFSNIIRAESWIIRIIWIFLIIGCMGYCVYTVVQIILTYLSFGVVVSYQIVFDSPSQFPAVTICNLNPFDLTTENTSSNYINNILKINYIYPNISVTGNQKGITLVQEAATILKAYTTADKELSVNDRKKLGFSIETITISCLYNREECSSADFYWFRDNDFGNCYTFNDILDGNNRKQDSKVTSKAGPENGLIMELFVGVSGSQDYYTIKRGFKVVVHKRGVKPLLKYDGIEISTGSAANIAISRTNYSKQEAPFSDCRKEPNDILESDSLYHKYTLKISKYYRKLCFEICLQYERIIPNCKCSDPSIPIIEEKIPICNNKTSIKCVKFKRDNTDVSENIEEICGKYCPNECNSIDYTTSVSSAYYPTNYYNHILNSQTNLLEKINLKNSFQPSTFQNRKKRQLPPRPSSTNSIVSTSSSQNIFFTSAKENKNFSNTVDIFNSTTTKFEWSNISILTSTVSQTSKPIDISGFSAQTQQINGPRELPTSTNFNSNSQKSSPNDKQTSTIQFSEYILMISIYYEDLKYTYIEESPAMSLDTMMGLIGGQFGLYMGASFLSFVEVAEMLINLGIYYKKFKKINKI